MQAGIAVVVCGSRMESKQAEFLRSHIRVGVFISTYMPQQVKTRMNFCFMMVDT
jgi:hypothetical protein